MNLVQTDPLPTSMAKRRHTSLSIPTEFHTPLPKLVKELRRLNNDYADEAAELLDTLVVSSKELVVDLDQNVASRGGISVELTPNQTVLLLTLQNYYGQPAPLGLLHHSTYGKFVTEHNPRSDNTVRVQLNVLRRKIEPLRANIRTVHGAGYQLELMPMPHKVEAPAQAPTDGERAGEEITPPAADAGAGSEQ